MKGFFQMSAWLGQKQPLPLIPECGSCGLDKGCLSPKMKYSGKGEKKVLIIAEAPGKEEDERGIQLVGQSGYELVRLLHRNLGINMRKHCWLFNVLSCRPPANRDPKTDEINWCRPNVTNIINELQPDVIIPMGKFAIQSLMAYAWKDGEVDSVEKWNGWVIPCQKLNTWICPVYHPSFLLRSGREPAVELTILKALKKAFALKGKPFPDGLPDYKKQVRVIEDTQEASANIKTMMAFGRPMAIDIETTTLKSDGDKSEILCCSVSDGITSIAFPWRGEAIEAVKIFLKSSVRKIVANLPFESRWFLKHLKIMPRNWVWDTVLSAHWLNCHRGVNGLKFQAFVRYGIPDFDSHIEPYKEGTGNSSYSPNRMRELEFGVMAEYCAYDSLFEVMVAQHQMKEAGVFSDYYK